MNKKLWLLLVFPTHTCAFFDTYHAYTTYQSGETTTAEELYASLAANNLDDWRPLYNLGTIALNTQKYADAVTHLERALALEPENATIQERLALAKKLRDEQKKQQDQQDQDQKKQDEQKSKEDRKKQDSQTDQQKSRNSDQQNGQSDRKEQEKQQANNANDNQQTRDTHKESESSSQQGQQEREKDNANNDTDKQRQEPMHGTSSQEQNSKKQTSQKKLAQAQALANDMRFSEEEKKFMQQLDKLDKQGQQQMLAIALAPSQAEQQFEDHNW